MSECKGRARPGDHAWGTREYYRAFGIVEVEITACMMCGQRKIRARCRFPFQMSGADAGLWEEMSKFDLDEKGESSDRQEQAQA